MPNSNIKDYKAQEIAYYNGKPVKILSTRNNYVTVRDELTGREFSLPKESLSKSSVYSYLNNPAYEERKKESKERIQELLAKGKELEAEQNSIRKSASKVVNWLNNFFRENDVVTKYQLSSDKREEYDPKLQERYDLNMKATQLGNQALSCFNAATREAFNMRKWIG